MNYLAHLYLSGESEKLMVGNFIGDYVKGKKFEQFPGEISRGILLHRSIDHFTDQHPLHKAAKTFFRDHFGRYSGIIVDFVYDHFLASNWQLYSTISLGWYAKRVHSVLLSNFRHLPLRVQGFLPFLIQNRRLESYATVEGIIQSIHIMSKYSSLPSQSEIAEEILVSNYQELNNNFERFMSELIEFVKSTYNIELELPSHF